LNQVRLARYYKHKHN